MHASQGRWSVYACVVVAWVAARGIAIVSTSLTPWMLNDLVVYQSWLPSLRGMAFPADDPTWQYPPGAALVFLSADRLPGDFDWAFTLVILAIDAAILAALMVAHWRRPDASWRGLWLWAFAGLVVGPIMMVRFDLVPTLFAVLSVLLVGRPALSGISAGLGLMVKLWPGLMLLALPRRGLGRGVVSTIATVIVLVTLFGMLFDASLSFIGNQRSRGLQVESVGALPYIVYSWFVDGVSFGLEYGSIQVLMNGTEAVGAAVTLAGVLLLALVAWWRLSGRIESAQPGDVALTVMLVSVATSRVYSPQFNVWLVGLASVALITRASRLGSVAMLVIVVSVLTQVVYPWSATELVTGDIRGVGAQALRIVGLLTATGIALWRIRPQPRHRDVAASLAADADA